MKRKILLFSISFILGCSLIGCGKEGEVDTTSTPAPIVQNEVVDDLDALVKEVKLCDYSKIPIKTKFVEITEEDIMNEMMSYISLYEEYEHITEGVVEDGKTVNISYVGKLSDGTEFEGGSAENYEVRIGSGSILFENDLVGFNVGETKTIPCTFPADYWEETMANKEVTFDVTVNYIRGAKIEPELTDEYVKKTGYNSIEELKTVVTEYLTVNNEYNYQSARENEILEYLMQNSELPTIPQNMIDDYKKTMKTYYETYASLYGLDFETFLGAYLNVTNEEYEELANTSANQFINSSMVLQAIANKENIVLSETELNERLTTLAKENGYENVEDFINLLKENEEYEEMKRELLFKKVLETLEQYVIES